MRLPATLTHACTCAGAHTAHTLWGSAQSQQSGDWPTRQSRVETTRMPQASKWLEGIRQASAWLPGQTGEKKSPLLPASRRWMDTFTFRALAIRVLCRQHAHALFPPSSLGSIQEIERHSKNWKRDRFAGVNGVLYTRCTNLKDSFAADPGRNTPLSWEAFNRYPRLSSLPFSHPCPPPQTQMAAIPPPPRDPDLFFSTTCPRGWRENFVPKMFHESGSVVPPETVGKCFLHPFLTAADDNDILCKINT